VTFQTADEIRRQKCVSPGLRLLGNEMPETRQGHAGRPALIDQSGHPDCTPTMSAFTPKRHGYILIDMGVGIDQSGSTIWPVTLTTSRALAGKMSA